MTEREMLELAAKAAGYRLCHFVSDSRAYVADDAAETHFYWAPKDDDGDALRLAVKVLNWPHGGRAFENAVTALYAIGKLPSDPCAATRLAIFHAAVEIGKKMP